MIRFLIGLGIFLLWVVWARRYYVCEILGECGEPQVSVDSSFLDNLPQNLKLVAGDYIILDEYPQFYFDFGSHAYTYVDGNEKFLSDVAIFLNDNPKAKLVIRGYYLPSEKKVVDKNRFYYDLGIARANAIIDKLIQEYHIDQHRIRAVSELAVADPITEPLQFDIYGYTPPKANAADTAFLEQLQTSIKDITYTDKSAKFAYNSEVFEPSGAFDVYVDSLRAYFMQNPNDYIVIIGHTDAKGSSSYNEKLGLGRAKSVRKYLEERGITVPIKTQSKGENAPLVPDRHEDGSYDLDAMSKNRRVNILIKSTN